MKLSTRLSMGGIFLAVALTNLFIFQNCGSSFNQSLPVQGDQISASLNPSVDSNQPGVVTNPPPGPIVVGPKDLSLATWQNISMVGAPTDAYCPTAVWGGNRVLVVGGASTGMPVYSYDPKKDEWQKLVSNYTYAYGGAPYGRTSSSVAWTGDRLVQHGGFHVLGACTAPYGCYYSESFSYNPANGAWDVAAAFPNNACRWGTSSVFDGQNFLLTGGASPGGAFSESWSQNYQTKAFTRLAAMLEARSHASSFLINNGSEVLVWGGTETQESPTVRFATATGFNKSMIYDIKVNQWRYGTDISPLLNRFSAASAYTGSQAVVWGGRMGSTYFADGAVFEPATQKWKMLPTANAPTARECAASVWTGEGFFVWGGAVNGVGAPSGKILK